MTTLAQYYSQKDKNNSGITTKKTFMVPLSELYVVDGEQGRPLNQAHAEAMRDAWIAGDSLPALVVEVTDRGIKIIDGQHRYAGAIMAGEMGVEIPRIECQDFVGTELEKMALQAKRSQGLNLTPLERAAQYNRALNRGYTHQEIAKEFMRSVQDIHDHIQLLSVGDKIIGMVNAGEMAATTAVAMSREYGEKAEAVAVKKLEEVKKAGKKKLTKAAAMPQFPAAKARRMMELLVDAVIAPINDDAALVLTPGTKDEIYKLLEEYRKGIPSEAQPESESQSVLVARANPDAKKEQESLPLTREDIKNQSGIETLACAMAAFGEKEEYTFLQSKYAHVWASDSVAHPTVSVIQPHTITKAITLILTDWVKGMFSDEIQRNEMLDRFVTVYQENSTGIGSVTEFINLLQNTLSSEWGNIRTLRMAVSRELERMKARETA